MQADSPSQAIIDDMSQAGSHDLAREHESGSSERQRTSVSDSDLATLSGHDIEPFSIPLPSSQETSARSSSEVVQSLSINQDLPSLSALSLRAHSGDGVDPALISLASTQSHARDGASEESSSSRRAYTESIPGRLTIHSQPTQFHSEETYLRLRKNKNTNNDRCQERQIDYGRLIDHLSQHMPHLTELRKFMKQSYEARSSDHLTILNFSDHAHPAGYSKTYHLLPSTKEKVEEMITVLTQSAAEDHGTRVVIAEDLSGAVIAFLGRTLRLGPELFAEHVGNPLHSPRHDEYGDGTGRNTGMIKRKHCSMRWLRPVRLSYRNGLNDYRWENLLKEGKVRWFEDDETTEEKLAKHTVSPVPRIFRREFPIAVPSDSKGDVDGYDAYPSNIGVKKARGVDARLTAWEEKVTIYHTTRYGQDLFVLLVDSLPILRCDIAGKDGAKEWVPFEHVRARGRPNHVLDDDLCNIDTLEQVREVGKFLNQTQSTKADILSWTCFNTDDDNQEMELDICTALLTVVQRDTLCLLGIMSNTLTSITKGTLDDAMMQDRLLMWRYLLTRYLIELPQMQASLKEFGMFASYISRSGGSQAAVAVDANVLLTELDKCIEKVIEQTKEVYSSLRTEMSILDSRRGIAEAESVSKLTELAFIFIPITFAASIFSMQVKELNEHPPPLHAFIIAAIVLIGISYSARLIIRSRIVLDLKQRLFKRARIYSRIEPGKPIPSRNFVLFLMHLTRQSMDHILGTLEDKHPVKVTAAFLIIILVPTLTLVWVKAHITAGFKIAITILITLLVCLLLWGVLPKQVGVMLFLQAFVEAELKGVTRREQVDDVESRQTSQINVEASHASQSSRRSDQYSESGVQPSHVSYAHTETDYISQARTGSGDISRSVTRSSHISEHGTEIEHMSHDGTASSHISQGEISQGESGSSHVARVRTGSSHTSRARTGSIRTSQHGPWSGEVSAVGQDVIRDVEEGRSIASSRTSRHSPANSTGQSSN